MKISHRLGFEFLYGLIVFCLLDILPFGFKVIVLLFVLTLTATIWFDPRPRLAMAISIAAAFFLINLVLPNFMNKTYYRPYERLSKRQMPGFKQYAPDQDVNVEKSYGDLMAVGFSHPDVNALKEERPQHFLIDANGYRKGAKSSGQFQAVLAGDSFVEGIGVDQNQSLSAQLAAKGLDVYNLGHNGDIAEYLSAVKYARDRYQVSGPVMLFAFEGNDFAGRNYCVKEDSALSSVRDSHRALKESHLSRFILALYGRLQSASMAPMIRVVDAGGQKLGFLEEYIQNSSATTYDSACLRELLTRNKHLMAAIYFIPDKSRVYHFLLPGAPAGLQGASAYATALGGIARELSIPFFDLTEPLRAKAQTELKSNRLLFWRDDTHWNPAGIAVAAEEAARLLTNQKR